jgi:hypothetical protein
LLRVVAAILLPVARVRLAPLPRTVQADLPVNRIRSDLLPVIIAAALPLAPGLAANELLRMIRGRLKDLLTITTTASTHQAAPDQKAVRSFCPEVQKSSHRQKFTAYRNSCRVFYRVPAHGAEDSRTGRIAALLHRRRQTISLNTVVSSYRMPSWCMFAAIPITARGDGEHAPVNTSAEPPFSADRTARIMFARSRNLREVSAQQHYMISKS